MSFTCSAEGNDIQNKEGFNDVDHLIIEKEDQTHDTNTMEELNTEFELSDNSKQCSNDNANPTYNEKQCTTEILEPLHAEADVENDISSSVHEIDDSNLEDTEVPNVERVLIDYDFSITPVQVTGSWSEFSNQNNYTKGCKWSPDGTCILTNSNDKTLRIFNLPQQFYGDTADSSEMLPVLKMKEAELIYDYCWNPKMSSQDSESCFFISCSTDNPIHLWDAFTGELRASYKTYNHAEEIISAYSLAFNPSGDKIYAGFNKLVKVFDVNYPGYDCDNRPTNVKKQGQSGIISCIAVNPADQSVYAAGSYSRSIGIYSEPNGKLLYMLQGQVGGLTHLKYSLDGNLLFSGGRKDPEILCWDMRKPGEVLFSVKRIVNSNQRFYFDMDLNNHYLVSGSQNGVLSIWNTTSWAENNAVLEPILQFQSHDDAVNGISFHPTLPIIATSSGQRMYASPDSDSEELTNEKFDNSLRLWWVGKV